MSKNRTNLKLGLIAFAVLALILLGGFFYFQQTSKSDKQYKEYQLSRTHIEATILSAGVVEPANRLQIKPPIAGRIDTVLVREGEKVRRGQILAWMSSTERAALLDSARAKGPEELKRWQELYNPTPILAPINGTVIQRNVEPGQTFTNADPVLVMSDRLTVKAQVDETDISQIHLQQEARLVLDAYSTKVMPAKVVEIAYDAKTVNSVTTYVVDVLPDDTPPYMRSGMTANIIFVVATKKDVLSIPSETLRSKDGNYSVLVKAADGQAQERQIEIGITDGKQTEIINGISQGDIVLVNQIKQGDNQSEEGVFSFMNFGRKNSRRGSGKK